MCNGPRIVQRTWDEVKAAAILAASKMKADGRFINGVYGIPRGGACLAVLFSHLLGVQYLDKPREGCLICDDIADTGRTLAAYSNIPGVTFYTDVAKETAQRIPDYYGQFIPEEDGNANAWVEFPWEHDKAV